VVLQCAKHNAKIYGVQNKITWFEGDCFEILKNQLKDLAPYSVLFASPPWGGMSCPVLKTPVHIGLVWRLTNDARTGISLG